MLNLQKTTNLLLFFLIWSVTAFDDEVKNTDYKIVCYYTNWAQYRPEPARFTPQNIDPRLCTHIIYSFAQINERYQLAAYEWNDDTEYQKVINLKNKNPNLKVLLAVGGWNHGSTRFSDVARNETLRSSFIAGAVLFLTDRGFDGLDLDWEYPASRDTENRPDDKKILLLYAKQAFKLKGLLLTAAVAAGEKYIKAGYDIPKLHKYLDFISLMAYDIHGAWENVTGHNAPLYPRLLDQDKTLNVDWAVQTWLSQGVPKEKLILGLAFYGRSFKLEPGFESCPITDTPSIAGARPGDYTREEGFLAYYEICDKLQERNWGYVWNEEQLVPYAYSNEAALKDSMEWVGFDDIVSIEIKVKYIMQKQLGGAMVWTLDMDDFSGGYCYQDKYPLLKTINYYLNKNKIIKSLPDASVNWVTKTNFSNVITETLHPSKRNESDFIQNYSHEKLGPDAFYRTYNIFKLMQHDTLNIYKFCQCKRGTQIIAPGDPQYREVFEIVVDCDSKELVDENNKKNKNKPTSPNPKNNDKDENFDFDSSQTIFCFKRNGFLCLFFVFISFIMKNLIYF